MRTGSTQKTPTSTPYITVTVSGDTYNTPGAGGSERIVRVKTEEEIWGSQYIIVLDNANEALNNKDYKGKPLTLKMGFLGETQSTFHPLWVWSQQFSSEEGKLLLQLNCVDVWTLIASVDANLANASFNQEWQKSEHLSTRVMADGTTLWSEGDPDTYNAILANGNKTLLEVVQTLCAAANVGYDSGDDDTYLSLKPALSIPNIRSGMMQAMSYTESYLKLKSNGNLTVFKPSLHGVVYTFNQLNTFYMEVDEAGVTIPNRIYFWSYNEAGNDWIEGMAVDTDSYTRLGNRYVDRHYLVSDMDNTNKRTEAQLDAYAEAVLAKIRAERNQGFLVAPMHCSLELLDKIQVNDNRYSTQRTVTGYVHKMIREYDRGIYRITIYLGGTSSGFTPPGGTPGRGLTGGEAPPIPFPRPDWELPPWEEILPKAVQGYTHNITFSSTDWNTVAWTAGTIKFYDGTTQAIVAGNTGDLATGDIYYIYFNLADTSPNVLKVTTAANYLNIVTENTSVLCVVQRASHTGGMAWFIPGKEKQPLITADMIYMAGLRDWTDPSGNRYQLIADTQISAGLIHLSASTSYATGYNPSHKRRTFYSTPTTPYYVGDVWYDTSLWKVCSTTRTSGSYNSADWTDTTRMVTRNTQLEAGYLKLTSSTYFSGVWYNETGLEIDANSGMFLYGTAIWLYDGSTYIGCLAAESPEFFVYGARDLALSTSDSDPGYGDIILYTPSDFDIAVYPYYTYRVALGTSAYYWTKVYSHMYYGKITVILAFQDHDDIAMLRSIKVKDGKLDVSTFPAEILEPADVKQAHYDKAKRKLREKGEYLMAGKTKLQQDIKHLETELQERESKTLPVDDEERDTELQERHKLKKELSWKKKHLADKEKALQRYMKEKPKLEQEIEDAKQIPAVDILAWESLLMGSILQLADKVEALEKKMKGDKE